MTMPHSGHLQSFSDEPHSIFSGMHFYDISVPVNMRTVNWENRFPVKAQWHSRKDKGAQTTNSSWLLHSHIGTHVDAPLHHIDNAPAVNDLEIPDMLGPAVVLDLTTVEEVIQVSDLEAHRVPHAARILLKTRNSESRLNELDEFAENYVALSEAAADYLIQRRVRLIAIDYLSIEPRQNKSFETHKKLLNHNVIVIEGVNLTGVPAGKYILCFLPLNLNESEAAPGRAILITSA